MNNSKTAYEIRLDIFSRALEYHMALFEKKARALHEASLDTNGKLVTQSDLDKIFPTKKDIRATAEDFYDFISNHK